MRGCKQLNKYLDLTGSADTSGNYRAGIDSTVLDKCQEEDHFDNSFKGSQMLY